ncbi:SMI1/KNR4 family protein [Flavobacterium cerinum]|nr:SMI1/KNR4 family protein [Flavobacterium cerinum]
MCWKRRRGYSEEFLLVNVGGDFSVFSINAKRFDTCKEIKMHAIKTNRMSYIDEIERLGGINKMYLPTDTTLNIDEILTIENDIGARLPDGLRDFLMKYGVSDFDEEVIFEPISIDAQYIHDEDSSQLDFIFEGSSIGVFYGKDPEEEGAYDIFWNIENYKDRMPSQFLPFATDGMGNQIVMSLKKENYGLIYFWDHEAEWDAEDYYDETGAVMPEEVKYQNLWLLANNFDDFFARLHVEV